MSFRFLEHQYAVHAPRLLAVLVLVLLAVGGTTGSAAAGPADQAEAVRASPAATAPSAGWFPPVPGMRIVRAFDKPASPWLPGHRGIDVTALPGEPVRSPSAGTVRFAGPVAGRPILSLNIDGHIVSFEPVDSDLRAGDAVYAGHEIGTVADPSHCADGCIHIGVWRSDVKKDYLDPTNYFALASTVLLPDSSAPQELPQIPAGAGSSGAGPWGGHQNGRIPLISLCPVASAPGHRLRCDAAQAFAALDASFRLQFGRSIAVTDSYRDYETQVVLKRRKGRWAATPGTSNHGWGLAVDLGGGINSFGSAEHAWMRAQAPRHGWIHPSWARSSGSLPEPWHWEFRGAG